MSLWDKSIDRCRSWELAFFVAILASFNAPLFGGGLCKGMIFIPNLVEKGEWWRVAAHPFVHLSWWHLLLDAGAFLLLYKGLLERSAIKRIGYVIVCAMGSLLAVTLTSPVVQTLGFCGLSGAAHGLMAISALESVKKGALDGKRDSFGVISLCIVVAKSAFEVIHGRVLFDFLHFGMVGSPIPASHAGGVLAGIGAFLLFWSLSRWTTRAREKRVVVANHIEWSRQA